MSEVAPAAGKLDFVSRERSEHEYRQAVAHSNKVRLLKIAMPLVGAVIILGIIAAFVARQFFYPNIDIAGISLQDGKLVMDNPTLNGFDKDKRAYRLQASKAIQDAEFPKRVELISITATLPVDEKVTVDVQAGNGLYDADAKTLVLSQRVKVQTSNGAQIELEDAFVDIGERTLQTEKPIFATSEQADIVASTLSVREGGEYLLFEGNVSMTLRPNKLREKEGE